MRNRVFFFCIIRDAKNMAGNITVHVATKYKFCLIIEAYKLFNCIMQSLIK